jgi:hypothetical protein
MTPRPGAVQGSGAVVKPSYAKLTKRVGIAVAVMLLGLVPSLVLFAITREPATTWATGAFIAGITALLVGGVEVAAFTVVIMSIIVPVAIVSGGTPIAGAALMALMCLTVGRMSRFGLHRATLLVPVFMAWMLISPPFWGPQHVVDRTDSTYLAWMTITFFVGGILPVIVLPLVIRKVRLAVPKPATRREAWPYAITITVLATGATFWLLNAPKQNAGAWLIATILVLAQVGDVGTVRRTIQRVLGTLLGMLVVTVIVLKVDSMVVLYCIGFVFAVAALTAKLSPHYWLYMALVTPTIICFTASSSSEVANLGEQRAQDTLIGAALVLLASAITIGYARLEAHRGHGPTAEVPAVLGEPVPSPSA